MSKGKNVPLSMQQQIQSLIKASSIDSTRAVLLYGDTTARQTPQAPAKRKEPTVRKFKDGDYVQVRWNSHGLDGCCGTVVGYKSNNYGVEFADDQEVGAGIRFGTLDGLAPPGRGYWLPVNYLREAVRPKPKPKVDFNSVIIADDKRQQIIEAIEQIKQHELIFDTWDFGSILEKGKGVAILLHGPPGTGKTLIGQAIADHENKKLKVVATADIESSVPGQAERNIREFFETAKKENCILLFDECDSLVYSRQSVGPIMGAIVNELLSQLERHEGITIFTTNRLGTLDEAVNRRLALKLEIGMPSREERVAIWKRMFPLAAPLAGDIDWDRLASAEMAGGFIKNAVLRAVRKAACEPIADSEKQITMQHLTDAAVLEVRSMIEFEKAKTKHEGRHTRVALPSSNQDFSRG